MTRVYGDRVLKEAAFAKWPHKDLFRTTFYGDDPNVWVLNFWAGMTRRLVSAPVDASVVGYAGAVVRKLVWELS